MPIATFIVLPFFTLFKIAVEMKSYTQKSTLKFVFLFAFTCYAYCDVSWNGTEPDGYLLGFKVVETFPDPRRNISGYNHASLFRIDFDGTVIEYWNHTLNPNLGREMLFDYNLFAVDTEMELVYLGVSDKFLALDLETGIPITRIFLRLPILQIFQTYDYFPKDKSIYGICRGAIPDPDDIFYWCHVNHTGTNKVQLKYLYQIPYANESAASTNIYYIDQEKQIMWYYPYRTDVVFAVAINYTTAKVLFVSGMNPFELEDLCIVHDSSMDRVFTYVWYKNKFTSLGVGELFPKPKQRKMLLNLSHFTSIIPSQPGTCAYDQTTHTMMVLMRNYTDYEHQMPTGLLLIDTVSLTYKLTPLPMFRENWDSTETLSAIKFIPNTV